MFADDTQLHQASPPEKITMTQDYYKAETTKRYDIPLTHLDYSYIRSCTDVKELEKILRVLRSGDEGHYPELEHEAEKRLETLNPKSRVLRKENPALRASDLDRSEQEDLKSELESWRKDMENKEQVLAPTNTSSKMSAGGAEDVVFEEDANLPPVRSGKVISTDGKVKDPKPDEGVGVGKKKKTKVMPRSYKDWDKFDVDKELEKAEENTGPKKKTPVPSSFKLDGISSQIDTTGMSDAEKRAKAIREKDKGNEAFHAHGFEESILYYSRSISIAPLAATYNNRALAYLRLLKWNEAINDCNYVLNLEAQNIKALLRRGTALKGKKDYAKARADLDTVLGLESNNKTAQDLLKEIGNLEKKASKEAQELQAKGRRMVIEEIDGSNEEEEEEIVVEKPDEERKPTAVVNGYSDDASASDSSVPESVVAGSKPSNQAAKEPQVKTVPATADNSKQESPEDSSAIRKDVWSEEEMQSMPNPEPNSDSQKPKLEAMSILSDQDSIPITAANARDLSQQDETSNLGSGDSDQTKADSPSELTSTVPGDEAEDSSSPVSDDQKESRDTEDEDAEAEDGETVEAEQEHFRPVLVQKALSSAEAALREKGNNFFRTGQYPEAIEVYGKIISKLEKAADQMVNLSLILSNRAACYSKTGDCPSAIKDCNASLELVPHSIKPLLRRAAAYEVLERYHHAYVDYKHILSVDSSVDQAHQGASRCQNYLTNHHGHQWRDKLPPLKRVSQWDVPMIMDENAAGEPTAMPQPSKVSPVKTSSLQEAPSSTEDTPAQKPQPVKEAPKPKVPSPEEQFEATKAEGNKHVQEGKYQVAVNCYSECVKVFADRAAVFTNRALCYLKLNKAQEAEDDCTTALALEPDNTKAFYRRALARKALKHYKDSLQDLLQLLRLETTNSAAKKEMDVVKGLYKKEYDRLKAQTPAASDKKKAAEPEKKRKRMKIEEVEDSDSGDKPQPTTSSASKSKKSGGSQKTSSTPSQSAKAAKKTATTTQPPPPSSPQSAAAPDSKQTGARAQDSRKPGRGKSKKGTVKETSSGLPVTPPSSPKLQGKITPFEFIQHWNSLKQAKDIQPYVQLLEQISPDDLPGVISNKLDGHMLQIIARCAGHDAQTGEVERAYSILRNIRQVPRFSTVVMFLSNKEKQDIRKVLESSSILGTHSAEEVAAVRKDYGLK